MGIFAFSMMSTKAGGLADASLLEGASVCAAGSLFDCVSVMADPAAADGVKEEADEEEEEDEDEEEDVEMEASEDDDVAEDDEGAGAEEVAGAETAS
jgi:hypothetical protein